MLRPVLITPPAEMPVSVAEAKANSRISFSDDDALVEALIGAATAHLDGYTGILCRCLVNQEWRQDFIDWGWRFRLPFPDVSSVAITYRDQDNAEQTVSADQYEAVEDARGALIVFRDAFQDPGLYDDMVAPISVTFTAGYGAAADVPDAIKAAIKLLVGHWYENREASIVGMTAAELPMAVESLITPYRRSGV